MAVQSDVTIRYVKTSGLEGSFTGSFYGENFPDCIDQATMFVVKYLRPAKIISANLTPRTTI
jgi:hypothetical protein